MTAKTNVRRIEQTGRFRATDEQGKWHTLHVFASLIADAPRVGILGVQSIRTEDGEVVEWIARGEYLTTWGATLRSDSPDAP